MDVQDADPGVQDADPGDQDVQNVLHAVHQGVQHDFVVLEGLVGGLNATARNCAVALRSVGRKDVALADASGRKDADQL